MRRLWDSSIIHRVSKHQLKLWAIEGVKKKEMVNKIVSEAVAEKAPSNISPQSKDDVFVSFRGEDIRHGFFGHLVIAFPRKQINAFVDEKLKRGDDMSHSLVEAIEGSPISLCKEKYGQIVIPVFYGVDPTNVRHQKKSYENAFAELEKRCNSSKVQIWRHALNTSANLSGIKSSDFRNDAELLEEIINLLLKRLSKHPVNSKGLIGIDKSIAHLNSLLQKESEKVSVIGIWGMGSIGKTTIAGEIFNQNCSEYEGCCFLEKVSEQLGRHGRTFLKEKLFSTLLAEDVKIRSPNGLSNYTVRRIGRMKVLIVLDDVKEEGQLEMLFRTLDWFRSDSRIILTTRDKQVLIANEVEDDDLYQVGVLDSSEALELFNLNAFKQSHLEMEYYDLSKKVVDYAKGIPLVLEVLAHLLRGKDKEEWESQLDKLKRLPNKKIQDVMRLSYDDLDRLEQKYFLDIACFFNGLRLKVDCMKLLLKDFESDNAVAIGLERLKDKALITISEDNVISIEDPIKCSQLWDPDIIYDVLKNDKGTDVIRSIRVDLSAIRKLKLSPHVFAKMTNLLFLDFHGGNYQECLDLFPRGIQSFPTDLRYISWMSYPLKSLPKKFSAENLVIFDLSFSQVEKLWYGVKDLVNLQEFRLFDSRSLKELPDLSKATNLKVLNITQAPLLKNVDPSVLSLDNLVELDLTCCDNNLSFLFYHQLKKFKKLRTFSEIAYNKFPGQDLTKSWINELPLSFGSQSTLETLIFKGCRIERIPPSIKNRTRLRYINLTFCIKLRTIPELPSSLETLLAECESLKTVWFPLTASEQFKENKKRVLLWNCLNLDKRSLINIELNIQINIMKFAYQHLSTLEHNYVESNVDYKQTFGSYQAFYVYPGSTVPEWLAYKTTQDDMIVDLFPNHLPPLLGFVFCFILAEDYQHCEQIEFNISTIDDKDDDEKDGVSIYMNRTPLGIASDHVCMIHDQRCSRYLTRVAKNHTRFKIKVTARTDTNVKLRERPEVELKGFGISPISNSTYHNLIQKMELFDYMNKWNRTLMHGCGISNIQGRRKSAAQGDFRNKAMKLRSLNFLYMKLNGN
ncbi:disease resistance protein (TIR-NBS-LRR class), putative [Medicago truncatula]|nr:disease resistance protein (TIR-NBS-LRR class), putative [Medicago truncatula]